MAVGPGVKPLFFAEWWQTVLSFNSYIYSFVQLIFHHMFIEYPGDVLNFFLCHKFLQ